MIDDAEPSTKLNRLIRHARKSTSLKDWNRIISRIKNKDECNVPGGIFGRLPLHNLVFSTTVVTSSSIAEARREAVRLCLEKYPAGIQERDSNGHTALHIACKSCSHIYLETLSDDEEDGLTPMKYEIDTEVVRILTTPPAGDPEIVTVVLRPPESSPAYCEGDLEEYFSTPLHAACECRPSVDLLEALLHAGDGSAGRRALEQRDGQGQLPIHVAVDYAAPIEAVRFLVEEWRRMLPHKQCSLEELGMDGYRALHFACNPGVERDTFQYIVESNKRAIWQKAGVDVDLPIHIAVCAMKEKGFVSTNSASDGFKVRTILDAAGKASPAMIRARNKQGSTPLHILCEYIWAETHPSIVEKFLSKCPELLELVDQNGDTALHVAARHLAPPKVVRLMIDLERNRTDRENVGNGRCPMLLQRNNFYKIPLDLAKEKRNGPVRSVEQKEIISMLSKETKLERKPNNNSRGCTQKRACSTQQGKKSHRKVSTENEPSIKEESFNKKVKIHE